MKNLGYNINLCAKFLKSKLNKQLEKHGITSPQYAVIKDIEMNSNISEEVTAVRIAERLGMDKPTISGIINRLNSKGLIEKKPHINDSRASILILTQQCKKKLLEYDKANINVLEKALKGMNEDEKEIIDNLLNKIINNLMEES